MNRGVLAAGTTPVQAAAIAVIIAAKFIVPLLIIRFPFAAGWANFVLDGVDGDLLIPLGLLNEVYQPVDKVTDWLTYVAIVVVAYRDDWPIRRLMLGLFVFRSVGQIGFLLTGNELLLALFPNFLEPLFLVTVTILAFERVVRRVQMAKSIDRIVLATTDQEADNSVAELAGRRWFFLDTRPR